MSHRTKPMWKIWRHIVIEQLPLVKRAALFMKSAALSLSTYLFLHTPSRICPGFVGVPLA